MGMDLEAIRRKIKQLETNSSSSRVQQWKPGDGKHRIRVLPWPSEFTKPGEPFVEKFFYYFTRPGFLCPFQFGKPDPVKDLQGKLYDTKDLADRAIAKDLYPKMRCYLALLDRDKPEDGIQVWAFGKKIYTSLLDFFMDEETNDWMDPKEGFDLNVTISPQQGSDYKDTKVALARTSSQLADSDEDIKKLLDSIPNINDMYTEKSTQEIEKIMMDWMNGGEVKVNDGTSRNASSSPSALDNLVKDVTEAKISTNGDEKSKKTAKKTAKKVESDDSDLDALAESQTTQDLSSAFDQLMETEE